MKLTTMGIDPSLASSGLVFLKNGKHISHARVTTTAKISTEERIHKICCTIRRGISRYHPDFVIVEGYSFASHRSKSATSLHELGGAIHQVLFSFSLPWHDPAPTSIKAFAGHGYASKEEMILWAQKLWPECPNQSDVADAFWCARFAYEKYSELVTPK